MSSGDTSVNDIGASTSAGRVIVGVGADTLGLVGDTTKTPGRRRLSDVGLLLEVDLAQVGLDNGILLDVVDLYYVSTLRVISRADKLTPGRFWSSSSSDNACASPATGDCGPSTALIRPREVV